jgi:hypothetical protein
MTSNMSVTCGRKKIKDLAQRQKSGAKRGNEKKNLTRAVGPLRDKRLELLTFWNNHATTPCRQMLESDALPIAPTPRLQITLRAGKRSL